MNDPAVVDSWQNIISKGIHESFPNDLLSVAEKKIPLSNKVTALPFREELVALKRKLLSQEGKREKRAHLIGLCKKYFDENNNALRGEYFELYLKLMDALEPLQNKGSELMSIYNYLDSEDFKKEIPEEYLDALEQYMPLKELVIQIRNLVKKL